MKKAFFLLVGCFISFQAAHAVEIYSAGRYFDSIEEYKKLNQPAVVAKQTPEAVSKKDAPVLDPQQERVQQLSYNHAVSKMVISFEQNWKNPRPKFVADREELAHAIEHAMKNRSEPALLIADPGKLRIMSYNPQTNKLVETKTVSMDKIVNK